MRVPVCGAAAGSRLASLFCTKVGQDCGLINYNHTHNTTEQTGALPTGLYHVKSSNRTQPAISPFILWFFNEIVSRKPLSPCVVKVLYEQLSDFSNGLYVNKSLLRSNELVQWRERSPVPMMRRTWTNATCNFSRSDHNAFKHCYVIKY